MLLSSLLFSAVQVALKNNQWQLLGVNGVYIDNLSPPIWGTTGNIISDGIEVGVQDTSYYVANNLTPTTFAENKTIGVLAIRGSSSPSGQTTLTTGTTVYLERSTFLAYDGSQSKYRMYLAGANNIPAIRIDFQANLAGKSFKVRFANENKHYIAYFNPDNTFDNPQKLSEDTIGVNTVKKGSKIIDVVDTNITDNNLTLIRNNQARSEIDSLITATDINMSVYTLTPDGVWALWDSRNVADQNGFDTFNAGRGYWVSLKSGLDHNAGIILGDQSINDTTHHNIYNGWNLVSFRDSSIRYSPTGIFVPLSELASGISLSYKFGVDEINVSGVDEKLVARHINWHIAHKKNRFGSLLNLRAFPSVKINATTNDRGLLLISDDRLELNISRAYNLSGNLLKRTDYNRYSTIFGDYMFGIELNDLYAHRSDINQSVSIYIPGYTATNTIVKGLNDTPDATTLRERY